MNFAKTNKDPEKEAQAVANFSSQAMVRRRGNCFRNGFDMWYRKIGVISIDNHFLFFIVVVVVLFFPPCYLLLKTLIFISVLAVKMDLRLDMH